MQSHLINPRSSPKNIALFLEELNLMSSLSQFVRSGYAKYPATNDCYTHEAMVHHHPQLDKRPFLCYSVLFSAINAEMITVGKVPQERRNMPKQTVIVLSTSHIQSSLPPRDPCEPTSVFRPTEEQASRGVKEDNMYSRGALEYALQEGHMVYVVTTRTKAQLGSHDQWWIKLVGKDHVFTTPPEINLQSLSSAEWKVHERKSLITLSNEQKERLFAPWRELFKRCGAKFPDGKYDHWTTLAGDLGKYGMQWGVRVPRALDE